MYVLINIYTCVYIYKNTCIYKSCKIHFLGILQTGLVLILLMKGCSARCEWRGKANPLFSGGSYKKTQADSGPGFSAAPRCAPEGRRVVSRQLSSLGPAVDEFPHRWDIDNVSRPAGASPSSAPPTLLLYVWNVLLLKNRGYFCFSHWSQTNKIIGNHISTTHHCVLSYRPNTQISTADVH